jgi:hypothetical protein
MSPSLLSLLFSLLCVICDQVTPEAGLAVAAGMICYHLGVPMRADHLFMGHISGLGQFICEAAGTLKNYSITKDAGRLPKGGRARHRGAPHDARGHRDAGGGAPR